MLVHTFKDSVTGVNFIPYPETLSNRCFINEYTYLIPTNKQTSKKKNSGYMYNYTLV